MNTLFPEIKEILEDFINDDRYDAWDISRIFPEIQFKNLYRTDKGTSRLWVFEYNNNALRIASSFEILEIENRILQKKILVESLLKGLEPINNFKKYYLVHYNDLDSIMVDNIEFNNNGFFYLTKYHLIPKERIKSIQIVFLAYLEKLIY